MIDEEFSDRIIPKIKLVHENAIPPHKAYDGDAGFDVYSTKRCLLWPNRWFKFPLGFAIELPNGAVAIISERSGMASKSAIMTIGNIIDSTYRGECHAILYNGSSTDRFQVEIGDRIAQMIIVPCYTSKKYKIVAELSASDRDTGGFGSTGRA